jgi:8-oxo-dGTP pyrophosphatase MutT (NUDIX family)
MALIDRIRDVAPCDPGAYVPFVIGGRRLGLIKPGFDEALKPFADVFHVAPDRVTLDGALTTPQDRTDAVGACLRALRDDGLITGWRDEVYPVTDCFHAPPALVIERAAVPLFGTRGYGVHINGYVRDGDAVAMWVATRSRAKPTGPGKLDQIVAGGQPAGIGFFENVIKECAEEAGIPAALARRARPVGTVSYLCERAEGVRNDILVNYDLELPADFKPVNTDGEVDRFDLWPLDRVRDTLAQGDAFKFNCALVALDFLVRWGAIDADDPDYEAIVQGLRAPVL